MTDWPEAVREYEVERSYIMEVCLGTQIPLKVADAAIAALKEIAERERALYDSMTIVASKTIARAEQAEAEAVEYNRLMVKAEAALLDELAKNALTPTGRERLEKAEAEVEHDRFVIGHLSRDNERLEAEVGRLRVDRDFWRGIFCDLAGVNDDDDADADA